jgi:hypothetical protein
VVPQRLRVSVPHLRVSPPRANGEGMGGAKSVGSVDGWPLEARAVYGTDGVRCAVYTLCSTVEQASCWGRECTKYSRSMRRVCGIDDELRATSYGPLTHGPHQGHDLVPARLSPAVEAAPLPPGRTLVG